MRETLSISYQKEMLLMAYPQNAGEVFLEFRNTSLVKGTASIVTAIFYGQASLIHDEKGIFLEM